MVNSRLLKPLLAAAFLCAPMAANACVWSSSAQYGSYTSGAFSWNNDEWGSGHGPQTICVNSQTNWNFVSNQPNTGGIKAYPHEAFYVGKALSSVNTLSATLSQSTPSGGAWDAAYDIWDSANQYEIMLWTNWTGAVGPISYNYNSNGAVPVYTNVSVGGGTWNVYEGNNGANNVISFLLTTKSNNKTLDLKAILNWIKSKGYFGNITVGSVQYGVEVTSTNGNQTFTISNWSLTSN
jgi:Glycosyl hydrolase family 12